MKGTGTMEPTNKQLTDINEIEELVASAESDDALIITCPHCKLRFHITRADTKHGDFRCPRCGDEC